MNDSPAPTATPLHKPLTRTAFSWVLRGGIAGLLIWITLWSLQGVSALFQSPPPPVERDERPAFNPISAFSPEKLNSGTWQFLDAPFTFSARTLPGDHARKSFLELPDADLATEIASTDQSRDLLKLLKTYGTRSKRQGFNQYSLDQLGIQILAFTRPHPTQQPGSTEQPGSIEQPQRAEQIVSFRWLIPMGEDQFWLITQAPTGNSAHTSASSANPSGSPSILPTQISHRPLAVRTDDSGKIFSQLILAETSLPDLLDQLQRNSWKFDAPPDHLRSGFVTIYLQRRSEAFWMLITPVDDSPSLRILLLRDDSLPPTSATNSSVEATP